MISLPLFDQFKKKKSKTEQKTKKHNPQDLFHFIFFGEGSCLN